MRRTLLTMAVLLIVFALTSAGNAQDAAPDTVKMVYRPFSNYANTFIGQEDGYFADQNIDLQLVELPPVFNNDDLTMLLQGDVDVLQISLSPGMINSIIRGENVKVVAAASYNDPDNCPYWSFVVAPEKAATFTADDLKGTKVAVPGGGATEYYLSKLLERYGLTNEDVTLENIPIPDRAQAVVDGVVSTAWLSEPGLSLANAHLSVENLAEAQDLMPDAEFAALIFGPHMLTLDEDVRVRFMTAYLQGSQAANEGPTNHNIEIVAKALDITPEALAATCWVHFRADGTVNTDSLTDYIGWLNAQGLIDEPIEVSSFYDPSYAEAAVEQIATPFP